MGIIAVHPGANYLFNNYMFEINSLYNITSDNNICEILNPFKLYKDAFKKEGYELITIDKVGNLNECIAIIFFDSPTENDPYFQYCTKNNLNEKMILFLQEPPVVKPENYDLKLHNLFKIIFTWNDDLIDEEKYYKFNNWQPNIKFNPYKKTYNQKKFCTLISGNKMSRVKDELYTERIKTIQFFERVSLDNFDFYGRGWNNPLNLRGFLRSVKNLSRSFYTPLFLKKFITYKGETNNKLETLSNYKFCICYENQKNLNGYITEKIIDCFYAGTVPVYWGASNIKEYIPENCFIDRTKFLNNQEMYNFIKNMDENLYEEYLTNISNYLNDKKFEQFIDTEIVKGTIETMLNGLLIIK